jgi:hypothetical protein
MDDTTSLGTYLRAERERRGMALRTISENTKVSLSLLEGLESDDISRWPGGIFRRAFVRSYAESVGLDPDDVFRRFEQQHKPVQPDGTQTEAGLGLTEASVFAQSRGTRRGVAAVWTTPDKARFAGTAADLTVAAVLAFGSAAAGSRLLWPVLLIAAYYAAGVLFTGTSPMVALLGMEPSAPKSRRAREVHTNSNDVDALLDHSSARSI